MGLGDAWNSAPGLSLAPPGSVELVVRSYAKELPMALIFLKSVELYWPWQRVLMVLDDEEADYVAAAALPAWCRVLHEAPPPYFEHYWAVRYGALKPPSKGYVRAQWSMFQLDRYTDAEYIAFCDSDVVFFNFVTPRVLFSFDGKPILKGHRGMPLFHRAIAVLGWQWVAEFMQSFPLLLHRSTLSLARVKVTRAAQGPPTRCMRLGLCKYWGRLNLTADVDFGERHTWDFNQSFLWLNTVLAIYGLRGIEDATVLPCAQTVLGHVAWHHQRSVYGWSIMDEGLLSRYLGPHEEFKQQLFVGSPGALMGLPAEAACPSLTVAFHLGHFNADVVKRASAEYFEVGRGLMLWGICDAEQGYILIQEQVACTPIRKRQSVGTVRFGQAGQPYDAARCAAECWARPPCKNFSLSRELVPSCWLQAPPCSMSSGETFDLFALRNRNAADAADDFGASCWSAGCANSVNGWCQPHHNMIQLMTSLSHASALDWIHPNVHQFVPGNCTGVAEMLVEHRLARAQILHWIGRGGLRALAGAIASSPRGPPSRSAKKEGYVPQRSVA